VILLPFACGSRLRVSPLFYWTVPRLTVSEADPVLLAFLHLPDPTFIHLQRCGRVAFAHYGFETSDFTRHATCAGSVPEME